MCAVLTNVSASGAQWGSRGREFDSRHSDHKTNDFTLEIVGFFVYRLASFGFNHNFDHNAKDFIWSMRI